MFDMTIIDSDAFLDLSFSAQALYFHLFARSDAEGNASNPRAIMRAVRATEDDREALKVNSFVTLSKKGVLKVEGKEADSIG